MIVKTSIQVLIFYTLDPSDANRLLPAADRFALSGYPIDLPVEF
jgi:hypothetical protein